MKQFFYLIFLVKPCPQSLAAKSAGRIQGRRKTFDEERSSARSSARLHERASKITSRRTTVSHAGTIPHLSAVKIELDCNSSNVTRAAARAREQDQPRKITTHRNNVFGTAKSPKVSPANIKVRYSSSQITRCATRARDQDQPLKMATRRASVVKEATSSQVSSAKIEVRRQSTKTVRVIASISDHALSQTDALPKTRRRVTFADAGIGRSGNNQSPKGMCLVALTLCNCDL